MKPKIKMPSCCSPCCFFPPPGPAPISQPQTVQGGLLVVLWSPCSPHFSSFHELWGFPAQGPAPSPPLLPLWPIPFHSQGCFSHAFPHCWAVFYPFFKAQGCQHRHQCCHWALWWVWLELGMPSEGSPKFPHRGCPCSLLTAKTSLHGTKKNL